MTPPKAEQLLPSHPWNRSDTRGQLVVGADTDVAPLREKGSVLNKRNRYEVHEIGSRRRRIAPALIIAGLVCAGSTLGAGTTLAASAAFQADGNSKALVAQGDVQAAWQEAVARNTEALPPGQTLPGDAPRIFTQPEPEAANYYEAGLFDTIVRQYVRCSWLSVDAGRTPLAKTGAWKAEAAQHLDAFADALPSESLDGFSAYQDSLALEAQKQGVRPSTLEYETDCVPMEAE